MTSERLSPAPEENTNEEELHKYERESRTRREAMRRVFEQSSDEEIISSMRYAYGPDESLGLDDIFDEELAALPERDVDRARSLAQKLARSPHSGDRRTAMVVIHNLTEFDHDLGVSLWDQLARDRDKHVRATAYGHVDNAIHDNAFASFHITLDDALRLRYNYEQAEQGRNIHDPDRDSYNRFSGLVLAEQETILQEEDSPPAN